MIKRLDNRSLVENAPSEPAATSWKSPSTAASNPVLTAGYLLLLGYVFLAFSRVLDVLLPGLRLPLFLYISMFLATLLSGCLLRFLGTSIGRWLFALSLWLIVTIPFSTWPGGSAPYVVDTYRSFIFAAVILGLTVEMPQVYKLIRVIAYSILVGALLSFGFGELSYGRLILPKGTFGDPNQFAMTLLFSLPFWMWIAQGLAFPAKLAPYLCMAPVFIAFLKTGSRGAGLGFVAFCAVGFWQAPLSRKAPLLLLMLVVPVVSLAFLPSYLKERYFTFFRADTAEVSSEREREMLEGADVGSSQGRLILLVESIQMTGAHPLFGVGAGQFAYQAWQGRRERGIPGIYNVTHNTFTQISSELGVPGLIMFLGLLISCFRAIGAVKRLKSSKLYRPPPRVIETADSLFLALVVLTVCACFLSLAYGPLFFVVPAVIAVFHRAVQNALPGWRVVPVPVSPATATLHRPSAARIPGLAAPGFGRSLSHPK
jgi:O-antigen ligase